MTARTTEGNKKKDKQPMKELKEWYAGLSMSSVQSNHVGNSRRQKRPTNLLQTLLLLMVMITVGGGNMLAQTSLGSVAITTGPTAGGWFAVQETGDVKLWIYDGWAQDNGPKTISEKTYVKLTNSGFFKIRVNKGYVQVGDILRVDAAFYYGNSGDSKDLGFRVEGSNTVVTSTVTTETATIDYVLKESDINTDDGDSQYDMIKFNRTDDGSSFCYHSVELLRTQKYNVSINLANLPSNCDAWFTLNEGPTQYRTQQTNVPVGTTVTYTMASNDPHHTPNGWRTQPWQKGDDLGWMGNGASFTTTVRSEAAGTDTNEHRLYGDLNPYPEYNNLFMVYAIAGEGGTATVTDASGHDMSTGYNCSEWAPNEGKTGNLTFTASPNSGYTFDGWYNSSDSKISSDATYNYGSYASIGTAVDLTLTAKFNAASNNVNITIDPIELTPEINIYFHGHHPGCVHGTGDNWGSIANGAAVGDYTSIDVSVADVAGYTFDGWYENEAKKSDVQTDFSYGGVHGGCNLVAKFTPNTPRTVSFEVVNKDGNTQADCYGTVTATVNGNSITSGSTVLEGQQVVFTATPANGKIAWGWYNNSNRNYEGNPYTVTVGDADITVNAVIHDGIILQASNSSSTSSYGTTRIECSGDRGTSFHTNPGTPNIQFVATPKTGVTFAGWYSDEACNTQVSTDNPFTIADPKENTTLYAKFTVPESTYGIVWSADIPEGCDAWFTVNGGETKYKESVFGLAADASIHYQATDVENPSKLISNWTVGGNGWYNSASDRTFKISDDNVTKNNNIVTLRPNFDDAYTYKATASAGCTVSVVAAKNDDSDQLSINGKKISKNDGRQKITLTTTNSDDLTFDGWYEDGTKIEEAGATYVITITNETKKDRTFEARYTIPAPIGGQRVKAQLTNLAKGNVPTWENGHLATDATSYNHVDIFRFSNVPDGNVNVTGTAADYTGIRFHANASTPFRVLVYINGETNPRIVTLESGEKEYTYTWAELGVPAASIENIARVCFAGQQNGSTDVTFKDVWVEKIDDPCHTFVMYGETGGHYDSGTYTYTLATPEGNATAVFNSIGGGSRRGYTKEIKLENELTITAPSDKRIKAVKVITDVQATDLVFTLNGSTANNAYSTAVTDGNEVVWTHDKVQSVTITNVDVSAKKAHIAKIEVIYDNDNIKHPALNKNAPGQYAANLAKITTTGGFAYDAETNTVYSSSTEAYGGDIRIDFETPQDFTNLTKIIIGSDDTSIFNFCNLVPTTAVDHTQYIGVRLGADGFTDEQKTAIDGKQIKTIILGSSALTTGKMKLDYIGFDISHMEPRVALDEGMQTEYTISLGSSLNLSAHPTSGESTTVLWSKWKGENPTDGPVGGDGTNWWTTGTYKFTPSTVGTYYFGVRLQQDCSAHSGSQYNTTPDQYAKVVKVVVVENTINKQLLLDFTDNTYTEPGESKGRQYRIYVPQSICNGSDADKANVPVVFSLHGTTNDNDPAAGGVQNFNELAETNKFIVVYPRGRNTMHFDVFGSGGVRGWEATGADNEDTKFFRAIIADLKGNRDEFKLSGTKQFTIDESRIYFTGFSNGGMMAYAVANTDADKFAAFASISGLPMNEMHMRHHNKRPVPFLHIHGTKDTFVKYSHMPTIVDNMLFRNGLPLAPSRIAEGAANGGATRYKMNAYTDEGCMPYYYFEIGTGSNTSDTGMGHDYQCTIGDKSSMQVIWEFFSKGNQSETPFTCPNTVNNPFEFKARINTANNLARDHGWQTNTSSGILAQYGESGGYTTTGENVYHTIHLTNGDKNGKHSIQFTAKGTSTNYVMVKVTKLADFTEFNTMGKHSFAVNENVILNNVAYYVRPETDGGVISIPFEGTEGEYMITITKGGKWDNTTLEDVAIVEGEVNKGVAYDKPVDTNFGGYFNYNNRLFAQWNFDLSDGYRTNARRLQANSNTADPNRAWTANLTNTDYNGVTLNNGTVVFTNHKPLGTSLDDPLKDTELSTYDELTYNGSYTQGGSTNDLIAAAAGLKFKAPAESVKIYVDITNGQVSGAHLVVNENVKMYVPYVTNSYRNDKDEFSQPQDHKDDFKNCMHHINRDILYIALNQGTIWDEWTDGHFISQGHVKNECIDLPGQDLFRNGGDEYVNGKNYNKADYMGKAGTPCIIRFNRETNIDRIGVNRNMTYSFYTEYISELGMTKPSVHQRIVGSPTGQKIANDGDTWTEYTNAVAFTYGGWKNDKGGHSYKSYDDNDVNDDWSQLGVYSTDGFHTWGTIPAATAESKVPVAIDGFPVATKSSVPATSEKLMPSNTTGNIYHPANDGTLSRGSYAPNVTPWTLPCRGAYGKYEVSYPGVLNADIVMKHGEEYYIADEFGKLIDQKVFSKRASGDHKVNGSNPYSYTKVAGETSDFDYVKLSFNAYPGKTYYIFSNTAGIGLSGFYYEPFVYRPADGEEFDRIDVTYREMELKDTEPFSTSMSNYESSLTGSETISSPTGTGSKNYTIHYSKDAVKVTLNRSFNKDTWNSICLPYSINQAQMENVFGVGTEVILLRDIRKAGTEGYTNSTLNFITHANQDIIAGYPYLIKPTKAVSNVVTYACLSDGQVATEPMNSITSTGNFTGDQKDWCMPGFTFTGTFDPIDKEYAPISVGSFYMAGGYLYQATEAFGIKGYRAWLKYSGDLETAKAIQQALVDDIEEIEIEHVTGIEEVKTDTTVTTKSSNAIYNINGQMVGSKTSDFRNLPKGIYIINGRKHIVK